jgi:hypothetical protein
VTGPRASELLRGRVDDGHFETWFEHDQGRLLAVVINGTRAVVLGF